MASESTPLRGASPRRDIGQELRRRRLAGLAVFAVVIVVVAFWVSISASRQAHEAAKPEPIMVKDVPSANTSEPATPVPTDATKAFTCGTAANEADYIKLPNKQDDHYFYWFFESRSKPSEDPLVLWLTGGAGCSSIMALLTENGPCTVNEDLTTMLNPYSWNTEANVIWLDQPTNVGFSYGVEADLDYNEDDVQESIYWFLHRFLDKHPEFEGRPFFITGESYAGHYIPAAAHYIWLENKAIEESNTTMQAASAANGTSAGNATARINLQGIAIGNGLVNPVVQFPHFLDMIDNAYNVTLLNDTELAKAKAIIPECEDTLYACQVDSSACFGAEATCNELVTALTGANRSMFDIREECYFGATGDNCQGTNMTTVTRYLNSEPVKAYLNISEHSAPWELCTPRVGEDFAGDEGKNFAPYVADLLNDDAVRVLVYNGDADMMCNWYGGLAWTQQLEWKHQKEFNAAKESAFVVTGKDQEPVNAGTIRAFRDQLTFLRVFNSGHMVPHDQPLVALDMISRFIKNEAL